MRAIRGALTSVLLVLFLTNEVQLAQGQGITVETESSYQFGESIQLSIRAEEASPIARAAVFLRPESSETARVVLAKLHPEDPAMADVLLDPAQLPIFAFETLFYWWQIDFDTGEVLTTEVTQLEYNDDRFAWQSRAVADVRVLWHDRTLSEGQAILETTQLALDQIEQSFALTQSAPFRIVIYNSANELQSALSLVGISTTTGHAEPGPGIVLISASGGSQGLFELERLIPHEMVHMLLVQSSPSKSVVYPVWLSEGMATLVEGSPTPAKRASLDAALHADEVIRFVDLCASFPISGAGAQLAYAQSGSFLRYLVDIYGVGGIHQLLSAYQEGTSCTGAVQRVFQRSLDQLQSEWRSAAMDPSTSQGYLVWAGLPATLLLLGLGYIMYRRRRLSTLAAVQEKELPR